MADLPTPPKPVFTRTISFGNMVQIALILIALGGAWATMQGELADMGEDVIAERDRIDDAIEARIAVEARVRALEIEAARADERYSQLVAMISTIRDSIVRLEQSKN